MIVSRGRLVDGYTTWEMNITMALNISLFYVSSDSDSDFESSESEEISQLRDEIDQLHEMIDDLILDK
jgi:hypothetical protein